MKRKRAALITFLLLAALSSSTGLWLRAQQRQYALNRQLIAALVAGDDRQALRLVNAGADPSTYYQSTPMPSLTQLLKQLLHRSMPPANDSPSAFAIACGAPWELDLVVLDFGPFRGPDYAPPIKASREISCNNCWIMGRAPMLPT